MLLDVQLPDGDGLQLLRDLKARGANTQTVHDSPRVHQCRG